MTIHRVTPLISLILIALAGCTSSNETDPTAESVDWPDFPTAAPLADSDAPDPYADETSEQRDARMAWWRYAKFGMFIHWGVYAVPAGTYNGEPIDGIGEWIMLRGKIPIAEYRSYAEDFNPTAYDPEAWAELAKQAGMKYIVITSKHHDGFALFPSDVTDWDVADATPYGKDLIGPLAEAAREEGLKFGLYYSQAQDWTHPGGSVAKWAGGEYDESHKGDMDEYIDQIAVPQVREILTRYQPDVLWWDTPVGMNEERADKLIPLLRLNPGIIHNNRLGGGYEGDTETPEQHIPATGFDDRDWEVCMTMNDTWGYKSYDHNWKSTESLVRKLCDIVSKGGNFLLNVGPTKEGRIPQPSIERLKEVGDWMEVNGESIYGTSANPFAKLSWGRCTKKIRPGGATLYFHVFDWPDDGKLRVDGLKSLPSSVSLLANGESLPFSAYASETALGITLELPTEAPSELVPVIKVEIPGELEVVRILPKQDKDGALTLGADMALLDSRSYNYNNQLKLETSNGIKSIENWKRPNDMIAWEFKITQPGRFSVQASVSGPEDSSLTINLKDQEKRTTEVQGTGSYDDYQIRKLGEIEIPEAGEYQLELRGVKKDWQPINVRSVQLTPVK
ncbi:MAG: alpha-L-fucosidase [Opitutales bacterium]